MRITQDFAAIIGDNGILFYDRPFKRLVSIKVSLGYLNYGAEISEFAIRVK